MGIFCNIYIEQPENKIFTPGSIVSGKIKYAIDKETVFKRVIVSLKGIGKLCIEEKTGSGKNQTTWTHYNSEEYVNEECVVYTGGSHEKAMPIGQYDTSFVFRLPVQIPSSINYQQYGRTSIDCTIKYYIDIKFERIWYKPNKRYEKEIKVRAGIIPKLPMGPIVYGEIKKLFQPFHIKESVISIKATIPNSILEPGSTAEVFCEVSNNTNKIIKGIKIKLIEIHTFHTGEKRKYVESKEVPSTESKTSSIKIDETKEEILEIKLPTDLNSMDNSKFVTRDYIVIITALLPIPFVNPVIKIPIQVGNISEELFMPRTVKENSINDDSFPDQPPSYWEAMNESYKENESVAVPSSSAKKS